MDKQQYLLDSTQIQETLLKMVRPDERVRAERRQVLTYTS